MKQTKLVSIIEVCTNVGTGFLLAMLVWIFVIPLFWPRMAGPVSESFWVTFTFTTVSILRGYFWRRFFAGGFHTMLVTWTKKIWNGNAD